MSALDDRLRSAARAVHEQTEALPIPETADEPEPVDHDRRRSGRLLVALAAAVVVVLVASVTVALTRERGSGSSGGGLTIEALAATTEKQSARMIATVILPPLGGEHRPTSNCPPLAVGCTTYYKQEPVVLVMTGLIDFRSGNGRVDLATRDGSHGSLKRFATDLIVDGHVYGRINASTLDIPAEIRRTKRWIESKLATERAGLNPFDPLAFLKDNDVKLDDRGMTRLGNQSVHHYHGVMRIPYTPPSTNGATVTVTSTLDIYVDTQNRLVRLRSVDHQPRIGTSSTLIEFSDYGVRVNVTAPPADQVYSPPDVPPNT